MKWEIVSDRPVYLQLTEQIERQIVRGEFQPGERLPSVRELALEAGVNPNTMQKALSLLETQGLVYSKRTAGRFITEDKTIIDGLKHRQAEEKTILYLNQMRQLGLDEHEIHKLFLNCLKGENNERDTV